MRPNQLYAISLPYPLLSKERAKKVFDTITNYLLTPRGLRRLSPLNKNYKPAYGGGRWMRDGSYHQGTVWSYLIGAYMDALLRIRKKRERKMHHYINKLLAHLNEAGVGTVSEIFDGCAPHTPRGCIAQAWGVGEVLRVAVAYELVPGPELQNETEPLF